MGIIGFFKNAFLDMKRSAKAQHEVTRANFNAAKAGARATWEEAKLSPSGRQALMQQEREKQIAEAEKRRAEAEARIQNAKDLRK